MGEISFDIDGMKSILHSVAVDLKSHSEELRQLDAKVGDGDLGVTIELASQAISEYLASSAETDIGKLLAQCGMNINKVSPSTFGTILASAFMGGGKAVVGKEKIGLNELILIGEGAVENIKKRGKAEAGDKTLLDALIPAVERLKKDIAGGMNEKELLESAVKSAEDGMKSTVDMKAKFGRAQWFKEGSVGVQDGGATAIFYMIKSFAEHMRD
ncbi:MAG: dihydroxyacetone kinase subunit L [Dehalococcoidales bacterium]|nr:dihydroxyacetone kinase subunit L [Dehalococcoidales bacterium]